MPNDEPKKLYRSKDQRLIAGVCGGIAEHFNIDPIWPRLIAVLLVFADGVGILLYIIGWILIPEHSDKEKKTKKSRKKETKAKSAKSAKVKTAKAEDVVAEPSKYDVNVLLGTIFILLGAVLLMKNMFGWFKAELFWPAIVIVFGLWLILRRSK